MAAAPISTARRALAARVSGDSTVATSIAFARAVENAIGVVAPARAQWLRALMAELERIANHLGRHRRCLQRRIVHADARALRRVARTRASRMPHGVRSSPDDGPRCAGRRHRRTFSSDGISAIRQLIDEIKQRFPELVELYDDTPSLQDRTVGTGILMRRTRGAVRRRRIRRSRVRPHFRRTARDSILAVRRTDLRCSGHEPRGDVNDARLDPHSRSRSEPEADRSDSSTRLPEAGA